MAVAAGRLKDDARDVRRLDRLMSGRANGARRRRTRKATISSTGAERELFDELAKRVPTGCRPSIAGL